MPEDNNSSQPADNNAGKPAENVATQRISNKAGGGQPFKLTFKQRLQLFWEQNGIWGVMGIILLVLFFVFFFNRIFHRVDSGQAAVIYRLLPTPTVEKENYKFMGIPFKQGTDMTTILDEGLQITFPWDNVTIYNIRLQEVENTFDVLSSNGLTIQVTMSIRYKPIYENLPELHKQAGPDYFNIIVLPEVQAIVRKVFGQYQPEEIYASRKFIIQNAVQGALSEVGERFVFLDDLLITKITLPKVVNDAIEEKLKQEQIALQFDFLLAREAKEAQRKKIEAEGIRNFQQIIAQGITENYLRFKGIEATLDLSKSPNSKIVIIGGGKDGLPIILDGANRTDSTASAELPVKVSKP